MATLDVGIVNDRTVLTVMHAEDSPLGRRVVLDRIERWQGSRTAPVDLGEVRDTLIALAREYRASAIVDPHQAVLIAQEARAAGVTVHEFAFSATSVGRLALSLHQAIRNHRIALPDDEALLDELASVRLRKNTLGIYRLDHDSGQHDDQAIALALGTHHLLDAAGTGAEQWIAWAKRRAEEARGAREPQELESRTARGPGLQAAPPAPPPAFSAEQAAAARKLIDGGGLVPTGQPGVFRAASSKGGAYLVTEQGCECPAGSHGRPCYHRAAVAVLTASSRAEAAPPLEGVVVALDAVAARKRARDAQFRTSPEAAWLRYVSTDR